jgi:hypothetical protein
MFGSNIGYQKFFIERSVYSWMYEDAMHENRHRKMLLYQYEADNTDKDVENIIVGIGISNGKGKKYQYSTYIVLNYVSPCEILNIDEAKEKK